MRQSKRRKNRYYRAAAAVVGVSGIILVSVTLIEYFRHFAGGYSPNASDWGLFGDYFGGVGGTVLTLLSLFVLLLALIAQAEELELTEQALSDQTDEIKLNEKRRVRPYLKAEWFQPIEREVIVQWWIRNVGAGPAILDSVELYVEGQLIGSHDFQSPDIAHHVWCQALKLALGGTLYPGDNEVQLLPMHGLKRAIGVGETQAVIELSYRGKSWQQREAMGLLDDALVPVVYFRSIADERMDTETQYGDTSEMLWQFTSSPQDEDE